MLAAWALFEAQCRDTIRKTLESRIPDGTYESEDAVDGDGMSGRSFHVRMRLTKEGGRISLDTRESDDQARGPINFIMHESVPKLIVGIYLLSGHPTVLLNDGAQDAIDEVLVRPGSILQPHWPAALGNRAHTLARVQSNVLALLALATGGDVAAPNSVYNIYFLRGFDRVRNEFFLCSDGVAVGYGARPFADGLDAIYYVAQKNYPAEFMEMVFPLRLRQYALHQDSGGPGRFRGGAGVVRELELLADEAIIAIRQDNILFPPAGVNGGHAGRPGSCIVNPGRPDERRARADVGRQRPAPRATWSAWPPAAAGAGAIPSIGRSSACAVTSWPASCRSTPPAPTTAWSSTPPGRWTCRHPRHCAARRAGPCGCSIAMATSGRWWKRAADELASLAYSDGGTVQSRHIAGPPTFRDLWRPLMTDRRSWLMLVLARRPGVAGGHRRRRPTRRRASCSPTRARTTRWIRTRPSTSAAWPFA